MKKYIRSTPEGTRDLVFEECAKQKRIEDALTSLFNQRGYLQVMTPTLEFFDVFDRESAGRAAESFYKLIDNQGRILVLRPDNTLPIARLVSTRLKDAFMPLRLFYNQSVFRVSPRLAGHRDETVQCGIELIGANGIRSDLEVIVTAIDALTKSGAADFRLEIGHAMYFKALSNALDASDKVKSDIGQLIEAKNYAALNDILDTLPETNATKALRNLPRLFGDVEILDTAEKLYQDERSQEAITYLRTLMAALKEMALDDKVSIDLGLVHRGNYYTGIVFRGFILGSGITVLTGGRYDRLIEEFGANLPATGFGIDVNALSSSFGVVEEETQTPEFLVFGSDGFEVKALLYLRQQTEKGKIAQYYVGDNIEEARKFAKNIGASKFVIMNEQGSTIELLKEDRS